MPILPSDYKLKIVLGIPSSGRPVEPEWAFSLPDIIWPMNITHAFVLVNCKRHDPPLSREQARERIVDLALHVKAEYVGMLDDDVQPYHSDWIVKHVSILDQHPEYDVIAGIYPRRGTGEPMVFISRTGGPYWRWRAGSVFPCEEIGTGCMVVRTSLFRQLEKPWFRDLNTIEEAVQAGIYTQLEVDQWADHDAHGGMTDDIYFCRKVTDSGHRILANSQVICRHWNGDGTFWEIPADSYPFTQPTRLEELDPRIRRAATIDGWMDPAELLWLAENAKEAVHVAEIGSYKGRSSRCLADSLPPGGHLVCVDTWRIEDLPLTPETYAKSVSNEDPDSLFDEFRFNMIDSVATVHPMRMTSVEASKHIPDDLKFDMIFIDGDHAYRSVKDDIETWRQHLAPNGLLCGHDYSSQWPGVVEAVRQLIDNVEQPRNTTIWYQPRNGNA